MPTDRRVLQQGKIFRNDSRGKTSDWARSSHDTHIAVVNETMLFCNPAGFLLSSTDVDGPCVCVNLLGKGRRDLRGQEGQQRDKWQAGQAQLHQRGWRSQKPQVFKSLKTCTWSGCSKAFKSPGEEREREREKSTTSHPLHWCTQIKVQFTLYFLWRLR